MSIIIDIPFNIIDKRLSQEMVTMVVLIDMVCVIGSAVDMNFDVDNNSGDGPSSSLPYILMGIRGYHSAC